MAAGSRPRPERPAGGAVAARSDKCTVRPPAAEQRGGLWQVRLATSPSPALQSSDDRCTAAVYTVIHCTELARTVSGVRELLAAAEIGTVVLIS